MSKGGEAVKISLVRAGRMEPAQKDSYRRVYKQDGTFHYPKEPENLLRKKGELYFKPLEITGSSEGTAKAPKFPLTKFWADTEIPNLEDACAKLEAKTGK